MKLIKTLIGGAVLAQCLLANNYIVNPSYVELAPENNPAVTAPKEVVKEIDNFPTYVWTYGCTPTAYGMILVYWVNNYRDQYPQFSKVFPEILKKETDIIPLVNTQWGVPGDEGWKLGDYCLTYKKADAECQFIASRAVNKLYYNEDILTLKNATPHVEQCWTGYTQSEEEVEEYCLLTGISSEKLGVDDYTNKDCVADYLKTSRGDINGGTKGVPTLDGLKTPKKDISVKGFLAYFTDHLKMNVESVSAYSQYVSSDIGSKVIIYSEVSPKLDEISESLRKDLTTNGFKWDEAKVLIDNNNPFAVSVQACNPDGKHDYHSVTCYGYKIAADGKKYLRCKSTWSSGDVDLAWDYSSKIDGKEYVITEIKVFSLSTVDEKKRGRSVDTDTLLVINSGAEKYIENTSSLLQNSAFTLRLFTSTGFKNIANPEIVDGKIYIPPFEIPSSTEWIINHRNRICGEIYALNDSGQFSYREPIEVVVNNSVEAPSANVEVNRVLPDLGFKLTASNSGGAVQYNGIVWDFGDGKKGRGYSVSHSYDEPGTYTVTVSMLGQNGETSISTLNLDVKEDITPIAVPNDIANRNSAIIKGSEALLSLQSATSVTINLFSLRGQQVASIKKGELSSGFYRVNLATQTNLAAGSYVVQVNIGSKVLNSKLVL